MDDVLGVWAGLGYYSRARNLRAAAREMRERHGGRVPDDPDALLTLPGIGRYTAGAVASIAFDRPEPVLDGNVKRVLARILEVREDVTRTDVNERLWEEAASLADGPHPGDLNQALMELGATLCTPRAPRCGDCPLRPRCAAHRAGDPEALPVKKARKAVPRVEAAAALVLRDGRALAVRRPPRGLMGGLWELPGDDLGDGEAPARGLRRALRERVGLEVGPLRRAGSVEHVFSHRHLRLYVYHGAAQGGRVRRDGPDAHRWLSPARLRDLPQGVVTQKALALVLS
jgi:A/G-specific adenine glycosylase